MQFVGLPKCVPALIRGRPDQPDSLPKYLVFSRDLVKRMKRDDLRIKIIDLGEGLSRWSHPCRQASTSRSFLQYRGT